MNRRIRLLPLLCALAAASLPAASATGQTVPTPAEVVGWDPGEHFTDGEQILRYMKALEEASPLVSIEEYGKTVEGRPLIQVVFAKPEFRDRFDAILAANRELTDPETSPERGEEIARENPAVVYLGYGIHGNESASPEAALWTAWELASGQPAVAGVLDQVIVVMDPNVNPDGRNRYVSFYRQARGAEANPFPLAREHREPWPGGRPNHYLFDLNRDWAWASQPETRARLATWGRWNPQVHVDFHEMGANSTYFFFPAAKPINPDYPASILEWGDRFGAGNAEAFDERGFLYFTGESYDLFYPGYGDSWPSLLGAIGMTYEMAGSGAAGEVYRRADGTLLRLSDRTERHRVSGAATLRTAATGKERLLADFARFHRTVDEGRPDILLVPGRDPHRLEALLELLELQEVRFERAGESFSARDGTPHPGWERRDAFPAGTVRVPIRQPRGLLAWTLLAPEARLDAEYSYDITAWSLPYAYGVEAHRIERVPDAAWSGEGRADAGRSGSGAAGGGSARVGYLLPPSFGVAPGVVAFLKEGGRARAIPRAFTVDGREWPSGSWFLSRERNPELDALVDAAGLRADAVPVSSGFSGGTNFGSGRTGAVELPRVLLLGGEGTASTTLGAHWFFLEQRLGLPFDMVTPADLRSVDLTDWDVIVAPAGNPVPILGDAGVAALERWVEGGGRLIAIGSAATSLGTRLTGIERRERAAREMEEAEERAHALRSREERERDRWSESVSGVILEARIDERHPFAFGADIEGGSVPRTFVLSSANAFEPEDGVESVIHFPETPTRVGGVISTEVLEALGSSAWLAEKRVGSGSVVLFGDDPVFRMLWHTGYQLYTNALLLGGSY